MAVWTEWIKQIRNTTFSVRHFSTEYVANVLDCDGPKKALQFIDSVRVITSVWLDWGPQFQ